METNNIIALSHRISILHPALRVQRGETRLGTTFMTFPLLRQITLELRDKPEHRAVPRGAVALAVRLAVREGRS